MKLSRRIQTLNGENVTDDGWSVWYKARDMIAAGRDVTLLCIGDHDTPTPDLIIDATKEALDNKRTKYAPVNGVPPLLDVIAKRTQDRTGIPTTRENVFVSNGGQGALFAAFMAACDPGDTVVVIDPYYATYPATVHTASAKMKIVKARPGNGFQIDADELLEATKGAKALLINTPNNPTGAVYNQDTLGGIRRAAIENDLWVVSDEVYDTQIHEGAHISPRQMTDMAERALVVGSLSKSHIMTGFRLGWLIGPAPFIASLTDLTNATTYGAPSFIQDAAVEALSHGQSAETDTAALYTRRRNLSVETLQGANALRISPPEGAMYVMLDIRPTGMSGYDFAHELIETHAIAVMPGESFGTAAAGHIRVALTIPDDQLVSALKTIADFAQSKLP